MIFIRIMTAVCATFMCLSDDILLSDSDNPADSLHKKWVVALGNKSFREFLTCIDAYIGTMKDSYDSQSKLVEAEENRNPQSPKLADLRNVLTSFWTQWNACRDFRRQVGDKRYWATITNRIIGHVVWAPPISARRYTQDVCVLKLVDRKFLHTMSNHVIQTGLPSAIL